VQQLAQEIFHSFLILSHQNPSDCTSMTKTFAMHKDSKPHESYTCEGKHSTADNRKDIDLTIRHFSSTADSDQNGSTPVSDFWLYLDNTARIVPPRPRVERRCEQYFSIVAVAAIHLANKVTLDTEDACSPLRLHVILKELRIVISSPYFLPLLFENQNNAFVYSADVLEDKIFSYEKQFLHRTQYNVSYWRGTVTATVRKQIRIDIMKPCVIC
jgi:hypothetical protein